MQKLLIANNKTIFLFMFSCWLRVYIVLLTYTDKKLFFALLTILDVQNLFI